MVDLSVADAGKWVSLLNAALIGEKRPKVADSGQDTREVTTIRQKQTRLGGAEIEQLAQRYKDGATVYVLAKEFGCNRTTVSNVLKRHGVTLRMKPLTAEQVDEAAVLYRQGLSLARVGKQLGVSARTVQLRLRGRGVVMRDVRGQGKK